MHLGRAVIDAERPDVAKRRATIVSSVMPRLS
jgi:hypothetical protein